MGVDWTITEGPLAQGLDSDFCVASQLSFCLITVISIMVCAETNIWPSLAAESELPKYNLQLLFLSIQVHPLEH
jgi:hypothetical protein